MSNTPSKALNCVIIDKNQVNRNSLARFCNKSEQVALHGTYNSINHALKECSAEVDLVFLDLEPDETGELGFVSQVLGDPEFIFTSTNKDAALTAFEYGAIDFLKKPVDFGRFEQAVSKALKHKKKASGLTGVSAASASGMGQFNWNVMQLLLTRSNRLTHQLFEYSRQKIQEPQIQALMTNAGLLQLYTNKQLVRVHNHNHANFTEISMVKIESVMQNAMEELQWTARQKGITFQYANNSPNGSTPANQNILGLLIAEVLDIMIRCAPKEGEINMEVQIAHHELSVIFRCGGLILDEGTMKKIDEVINLTDNDLQRALGQITEGALVSYFLKRMDAEIFVETIVGQGVSIYLSFIGNA